MKRIPTFLAGMLTAAVIGGLGVGALAASGAVTFNASNLVFNGQQISAKGEGYTLDNGCQAPASITYTDEKGGGTNYLPVRRISELLDVETGWDGATGSVTVGKIAASAESTGNPSQAPTDKHGNAITDYKVDLVSVFINGQRLDNGGKPGSIFSAGLVYLDVTAVCEALGLDSDSYAFASYDYLLLDGSIYVSMRNFSIEVPNINILLDTETNSVTISNI